MAPVETIKKYARFMAKCEANHIISKNTYDPVTVFATSKIQPLPYQLEDFLALVEMLKMKQVRSLLAYETGLGKTIVAGLVVRELLSQAPEARVLILVPPMAISQWIIEMETKFGLTFKRYESSDDLANQLLIASMDTLRGTRRFADIRERGSRWDLVVVDELHRATPGNRRYQLIEWLRDKTEHMLGLTATPHDGKVDHFIGRLQLINASVNSANFRSFIKEYCFRRQKKEVTDLEGNLLFPFAVDVKTEKVKVSEEEQKFYEAVENYVRHQYKLAEGSKRSPRGLLATIMGRMASSCIRTGMEALKRRRKSLLTGMAVSTIDEEEIRKRLSEAEDDDEQKEQIYQELIERYAPEDRDALIEELEAIERIIALGENVKVDSKLRELVRTARIHVSERNKMIVFTSFVATAEYLAEKLKDEFGEDSVFLATGRVDPNTRKENIQRFLGSGKVLVGTEVIGESLNLQEANVVYNYELPWSPIPYIQRVGRIYRYPQKKPIFVHNFSSQLRVEERVMEIVYRKVNNLIRDFDEGSVAVIGAEVTEETVESAIREAYTKGLEPMEVELEKKLEQAELNAEKIKEVLNISEAANRHVDASKLLNDVNEIVTTGDIRRFLDYAAHAGIGRGSPQGEVPIYYVDDRPVRKISIEDEAVKLALEKALHLPEESVSLVWDKEDTKGAVKLVEYLDGNGRPFRREVVVATGRGILPYKAISSLKPVDIDAGEKVNYEINPASSPYLQKEIADYKARLDERINYKAKLINDEEEMVGKMEANPEFRELKMGELRERKKELLQASAAMTVKEASVIGFVRLCSEASIYSESGNEEYNPEVLRRRHEVEKAAMEFVMNYERRNGWEPEDVHDQNLGYDIVSRKPQSEKYIEVKGISDPSAEEAVITYNEKKASEYFRDNYYLYVVFDPLKRIGNPILRIDRPPFEVKGEMVSVEYVIKV